MNITRSVILTAVCCVAANAGTITYTETQNGIGSFGGTAFNNALVTITVVSDTSTIVNAGTFQNIGTGTVTVAGLGTGTFSDTIVVVSDEAGNRAGITDLTADLAILFTHNVGFATYDLSTAIGPLSGGPTGSPAQSFATSAGAFLLSSANNTDHASTFTATLSGTPEPGTVGLIGAALPLLWFGRRRFARSK